MTLYDLFQTLHKLSNEFAFECEHSNLALIRGDILLELPKLITMTKGDEYYISFRNYGFECEPNIKRLQENPLLLCTPNRQSWRVFVDEYGFWQMYRLCD